MANNIFPVSIEKFAAYLDGNLSADEMQEMSSLIKADDSMQMLVDASSIVDETFTSNLASEIELPSELQSMDFAIPNIDSDFVGMVPLSSEPGLDQIMAAAACADVQDVEFGGNDIGSSDIELGTVIDELPNGINSMNIDNDVNSLDVNMNDFEL